MSASRAILSVTIGVPLILGLAACDPALSEQGQANARPAGCKEEGTANWYPHSYECEGTQIVEYSCAGDYKPTGITIDCTDRGGGCENADGWVRCLADPEEGAGCFSYGLGESWCSQDWQRVERCIEVGQSDDGSPILGIDIQEQCSEGCAYDGGPANPFCAPPGFEGDRGDPDCGGAPLGASWCSQDGANIEMCASDGVRQYTTCASGCLDEQQGQGPYCASPEVTQPADSGACYQSCSDDGSRVVSCDGSDVAFCEDGWCAYDDGGYPFCAY